MMKKEARVGQDLGTEHSNQRKWQKGKTVKPEQILHFSETKRRQEDGWEDGYKNRSNMLVRPAQGSPTRV